MAKIDKIMETKGNRKSKLQRNNQVQDLNPLILQAFN